MSEPLFLEPFAGWAIFDRVVGTRPEIQDPATDELVVAAMPYQWQELFEGFLEFDDDRCVESYPDQRVHWHDAYDMGINSRVKLFRIAAWYGLPVEQREPRLRRIAVKRTCDNEHCLHPRHLVFDGTRAMDPESKARYTAIWSDLEAGMSKRDVADKYGLSKSTILDFCAGRFGREITGLEKAHWLRKD
jgi:hypothetical protein